MEYLFIFVVNLKTYRMSYFKKCTTCNGDDPNCLECDGYGDVLTDELEEYDGE